MSWDGKRVQGNAAGYLFALGFVSILGQVVLLRELNVAFYGVELIYTFALGVWLLCTASGSMVCRRLNSGNPFSRVNLLFLVFAVLLPVDVAFVRSVRLIFTGIQGAYLPLHSQALAMCISLLPIGLVLGMLFRWMAGIYISEGRSLSRAYAIESIGGLAGGICATLLLQFGFQNFVIALICALIAMGSVFLDFEGRQLGKLRLVSLALFAVLILLVWKAPAVDRAMTSWTHPHILTTRDSPYSRITVTFLDGQVSVFENDSLLFDTQETRTEEFVQLGALQHPHPGRVLVLGGGVEGTIREILMHSPQIVDYVELNPALLQAAQELPSDIQRSLRAANVRIIQDDPRTFLEKSLSYDLILVAMPEPSSAQANRFYTQDFFRQCNSRLSQDGVMAFSLPSSENIWTPQLASRMVSIYRAAKSVFPDVLFIPGSRNIVISSARPLVRDPSILASRLTERGLKTKIVSAAYIRYLYTNDRYPEINGILESGTAPINTDARPVCYQYTVMLWLSKFLPSLTLRSFSFPEYGDAKSALWMAALGLPYLLLSRARWPVRRAALMGIAGFAGMALETILILHFQTKSGILFQDIGLLLTGFMAGLSIGALGLEKIHAEPPKAVGLALLAGFAVLAGTTGWCINSGMKAGLVEIMSLLFATGLLVSAVFSYNGLHNGTDQNGAIVPLYSADLIGGCLGSVLATIVLAPVIGLGMTAHLMIPLILFSALLL